MIRDRLEEQRNGGVMNHRKLFGMNAKQISLVLFGILIDLFVIGLLLLTVINGWEYTAALLSAVWQFVTATIPRMVIAALSAVFTVILVVLWFIASLEGPIRGHPSPSSPFRRNHQLSKPSLSSPETSTQLIETLSPKTESFLTRQLKWLRELEIKRPNINWGSRGGSGWPSGYYRSTHVRGYFRRDGTYVSSHSRSGYTRRSRRW